MQQLSWNNAVWQLFCTRVYHIGPYKAGKNQLPHLEVDILLSNTSWYTLPAAHICTCMYDCRWPTIIPKYKYTIAYMNVHMSLTSVAHNRRWISLHRARTTTLPLKLCRETLTGASSAGPPPLWNHETHNYHCTTVNHSAFKHAIQYTSTMLSILGEQERPHWVLLIDYMLCIHSHVS